MTARIMALDLNAGHIGYRVGITTIDGAHVEDTLVAVIAEAKPDSVNMTPTTLGPLRIRVALMNVRGTEWDDDLGRRGLFSLDPHSDVTVSQHPAEGVITQVTP